MPTPEDQTLRDLVRARDELVSRRAAAFSSGVRGLRLDAIDLDTHLVEESIRRHCLETGAPLPAGVEAFSEARRTFLAIATKILHTYLRVLALRRDQKRLALTHGELERAASMEPRIRADCEMIRKHCERSGLSVPNEIDDD